MSAAATAQARIAASAGRLGTWARQGFESFATAQKILLDLTAQQNALAIGVLRERIRIPSFHPGDAMAEAADQGVATLTTAGKILLDLAAGETGLAVDAMKEGLHLPPAAGAMADVLRHRLETFIEMHRLLLKATAEQVHAAAASYKDGTGVQATAHLAEIARQGIEGFVETEKKFLDLAAEEVAAVASGTKESRKSSKNRTKVLAQLAREGVDQFVDAEKKLMVLAIDQAENALKSNPEEAESAHAEPRTSFADVTSKTVQNFVAAQKSLMDLAIKPIKSEAPPAQKKSARRAPRRGKK